MIIVWNISLFIDIHARPVSNQSDMFRKLKQKIEQDGGSVKTSPVKGAAPQQTHQTGRPAVLFTCQKKDHVVTI